MLHEIYDLHYTRVPVVHIEGICDDRLQTARVKFYNRSLIPTIEGALIMESLAQFVIDFCEARLQTRIGEKNRSVSLSEYKTLLRGLLPYALDYRASQIPIFFTSFFGDIFGSFAFELFDLFL